MIPHFFGAILNSATNIFEPYMKLHINWQAMMASNTNGSESLPHPAAASSPAVTAEDELAHHMDIALGASVAPPA